MANIKARDADGNIIYLKATGDLTDLDPGVKEFLEPNSAAILADTANIDTNIATLAGAVDGTEIQVDIASALPAGDNNIGNVDIASSVLPTGAATSANQATIIGHVDGIEALIGTIDADTGAIDTKLGSVISGSKIQADVISLPSVTVAPRTLLYATGTISTSGNNTVIDISAASGYSAGNNLAIASIILQNESSTATTAIIRDSASPTANNLARVLGQNQGDGIALTFAPGREWRLGDDLDLVVNLSGANSFGYSIAYFLE